MMNTKSARLSVAILLVSLLAVFALGVSSAAAQSGTPVSGDGVVPTEYDGNTSCQQLGYPFGFKIEGNGASVYTGTFPFVGGHTGGAPDDPTNSVNLTSDGYYLNWMSTLYLDAVIVKGGQDANAYVYIPEDNADTKLASPDLAGGQLPQISHVEFCYDYDLTASKTANAQFKRTYSWEITKGLDGTYTGFIGDPAFDHNYTVSVDQKWADSDFAVAGEIKINNPSPLTVNFNVSDSVGGTNATVVCPSNTLAPWGTVTCTYSAPLAGAVNGLNTATITTSTYGAVGTTATADYTFGDPTSEAGYKTINVTDSFKGALGSASGDFTFPTYPKSFQCPADKAAYTNGVYVMTEFVNTATITETGQSDTAKVNMTCYAPSVSKDAFTKYTKKYTWDITKGPDEDYKGFIGDAAFDHDYTVSVDQTITPTDFTVYGTITVQNPNPAKDMTVSLADSVGGTAATLSCGGSLTVPKGSSATCNYSAVIGAMTDGTNTATATLNNIGFDATATYAFANATVTTEGFTEINVTDSFQGALGSASGDKTFDTYSKEFQCPADKGSYADGVYVMPDFVNTATIDEIPTENDSATVKLTCYAPVVTKDASTSWEEKYDWTITKEPDGTYKGFIGDPAFNHNYTVAVNQTVTPQNYKVYGKIYVANPAGSPGNMTVGLSDLLAAGVNATVDCGSGATSVTVNPGATGTCSYSGDLAAKTDGTNTATGTFNGVTFEATAPYAFGDPTIIGYPTINVTDTNGLAWQASGDASWLYAKSFQCPADKDLYTNGVYVMPDFVNTATIDEIPTENDSATVKLTCYAPVITKNATASYDERHIWDVEKSVEPESQFGFPGSFLPWKWTVNVNETFVEENFLVTGKIFVANPADSPNDMTVSLIDQLNDGKFATVDCGAGATSITVSAGTTGTCDYTANPTGRTATQNKATGTFNNIDFVATYPVSFDKNVVKGTATVTDTEIGLDNELTAGEGPWQFEGPDSHTCSTNRADYFKDGVYTPITETIVNWAYVKSGGVEQDKDDATTTWTCNASFVDILKTTNGVVDPTKDIRFKLYDGTGNDLNDEVSTLGDLDGQLQFKTALVPGDKYTVCESPVPAGYTFEIDVNGGNVLTFAGPPGTLNPTGEVQCFDFIADPAGTTLVYKVNNRYPGGAPRTPGYWKNWNMCTGGNQAETAAKLGGVAEGVYLLENLLPQTLGNLLIDTCQKGVFILDGRNLSGRNMSSDAAYILARSLLAARLNQDAGACIPAGQTWAYKGQNLTFEQILTASDALLSSVGFNGTADELGPRVRGGDLTKRNDALYLYGIIDAYNNGQWCTGTPSH
jgi:hypothetical protein